MSNHLLRFVVLGVSLGSAGLVSAQVLWDAQGRTATLSDTGHALSLHLRLDDRCMIDGVTVLGRQVVDAKTGVCTAVKVGGAWHTTRDGLPATKVAVEGGSLRVTDIRYGPAEFPVSEEWTLTTGEDWIDWTIARTYHAAGRIEDTYFPGFDFAAMDTWTGGILGTGGVVWGKYLDTPVATYGSHTGSVTFWNKGTQACLSLATQAPPPPGDLTARFSRHPSGVFSASFWPSQAEQTPAHGLARFLPDHQDVWRPEPIEASPAHPVKVSSTLRLRALPYDKVSPPGALRGIDAQAVRELLNTIARYGIIDRGISGGNGWRSSFTCTHEPWLAEFGLAVADPNTTANCAATLDEWKRWAITPEGRVLSRWHNDDGDAMPGTFDPKSGYYEAQWGYLLDSQPSYVVCVAEQFDLSGDLPWLRSHRDTCRAALEYMLRRDRDHDGLMEVIPESSREEKASDWIDIVWASHENALVNAEMYEALTRWASLEELLLGDAARSARYRDAAARLKAAFNKPIADGGFWNPDRGWYVYWREADGSVHGDNLVTPVNFAAIGYGLCDDPARRREILAQIETLMVKEDLFHWPLCFFPFKPEEVQARQKAFPVYENGDLFLSWAELAIRSYVQTDPALAVKYVRKVLDRYNVDGLSFQRCLRANAEGSGDDILAGNAMAVVGLYRDIYGIRPRHDRLFLDPHLTPELARTRLTYPLRGTPYALELEMGRAKVSAFGSSLTAPTPFGGDLTPTAVRWFATVDGLPELSITAAEGPAPEVSVEVWPASSPTGRRVWTVSRAAESRVPLRYLITGLAPNTAFEIRHEGDLLATSTTTPEGTLDFGIVGITKPARLTLEPARP